MDMIIDTIIGGIFLGLSSFLFSLLPIECIPAAALTLALLSTITITRVRRVTQRRIEKLEDEYDGQRAVNFAALENHRAAYLALQQRFDSVSNRPTVCTRAHYDHPSAETARENHELRTRLHQLRLGGKTTTTCTRTHHDRSTAEIASANRVLRDSNRKVRGAFIRLQMGMGQRDKAIIRLQRSYDTLSTTRVEEIRDRDAAIEDLERSVRAAIARHSGCHQEVSQLRAAAREARGIVMEFERELEVLRALRVASHASEDVDQQEKNSNLLQVRVDPVSEAGPLTPERATQASTHVAQEDDEEEL